jgi:hypothetical protein
MMDDLQAAYSAYQQALYHLRDPKVGSLTSPPGHNTKANQPCRNQNSGTGSVSSMIVTDP